MKGNASGSSCWNYGNAHIPTPHLGKFAVRPHDETDGICDHGDNAMIC
jgi:hypothetical protein